MVTRRDLLLRIEGEDDVSATLHEVGANADTLTKKLYDAGEAGGNLESTFNGLSDIAEVMGTKMGLPVGPLLEQTRAVAQLGGGIEALLKGAPALISFVTSSIGPLYAKAAAYWAVAAGAIAANAPLIIIIATVALVTAGLIYFFTQTEAGQKILDAFTGFLTDKVLPALGDLWGAFQEVVDFLANNWPLVASLIFLPFAPLILLATDAFGIRSAMVEAFEAILGFVTGKIGAIVSAIGGLWAGREVVFAIRDAVYSFRDAVADAFWWVVNLINKINVIPSLPSAGGILSNLPGSGIFRAAGGPVSAHMPYIVGEEGPELFVPSVGGQIIPNGSLATLGASRGSAPQIANHWDFLLDKVGYGTDLMTDTFLRAFELIGWGTDKMTDTMLLQLGDLSYRLGNGEFVGDVKEWGVLALESIAAEMRANNWQTDAATGDMVANVYAVMMNSLPQFAAAGGAAATAYAAEFNSKLAGSLTNVFAGNIGQAPGAAKAQTPYPTIPAPAGYEWTWDPESGSYRATPINQGLVYNMTSTGANYGKTLAPGALDLMSNTGQHGMPGAGGKVYDSTKQMYVDPDKLTILITGAITVNNNGMQKDARGTLKDVAFATAAEMRARGVWVTA